MTIFQLAAAPWRLAGTAARWHVRSQQYARANALAASTALSVRRREIEDVEDFLSRHVTPVPWAG